MRSFVEEQDKVWTDPGNRSRARGLAASRKTFASLFALIGLTLSAVGLIASEILPMTSWTVPWHLCTISKTSGSPLALSYPQITPDNVSREIQVRRGERGQV